MSGSTADLRPVATGDEEVIDKRVKVVLVGDSGAGKTQIFRRLCGQGAFDDVHQSTDIAEVTMIAVSEGADSDAMQWKRVDGAVSLSLRDNEMLLSLWDFGGRAEYFAVNDLFLTRGAVYVLVIDWTKGVAAARESAQRWMDAIRVHVGDDAHVLPVLPRCAGEVGDEAVLDEVTRMLEELVGCAPVRVDSATDRNYDVLKRQLLALADAQMAASGKVVLRWLRVHDELCRLRAEEKKQWITRVELRELLQSLLSKNAAAVSDDDVKRVLVYLKRSGTVLTSGGGGRASEFVFLDPELFLALVRPLINTAEQIAKRKADARSSAAVAAAQRPLDGDYKQLTENCVASRALLEHVWRGVASPTNEIGFFVELLEQCGLMCELEAGKYFVPAASKATPSTGLALDWLAGAEQIALVCADEKIKALPPSLLPRIVASLFKSGAIEMPGAGCVRKQKTSSCCCARSKAIACVASGCSRAVTASC